MKIDLHLHSRYSDQPVHWLAGDYPESLSEVRTLYKAAMQKGMDFVTLTDHNVIGGALELIERYPHNSFMSCEFDVTFPEDGCSVHIPVYNLTEQQYEDINKLRGNIYETKAYLDQNRLPHTLAHAFYAVNGKLTVDHIEKLLLMFKTFEINGSRSKRFNDTLELLLGSLTPEIIERLANKHGITPCHEAWHKFFTGGSDDHSGLKVAQKYTEVDMPVRTLDGFLDAVFRQGQGKPMGTCSGPESLAHSIHSIAYQQLKKDFSFKSLLLGNEGIRTINQLLSGEHIKPFLLTRIAGNLLVALSKGKVAGTLLELLDHTTRSNPDLLRTTNPSNAPERAWFHLMEIVLSQGCKDVFEEVEESLRSKKYGKLWSLAGRAGGLSLASSPYFISYHVTKRDEQFGHFALDAITNGAHKKTDCARIVSFTDTFDEMNGVAVTLKQQLNAAQKLGLDYSVLTCSSAEESGDYNEVRFKPVVSKTLPHYPELSINVPPLLQILDYCYRYDPTHLIAETEGLMGWAALAVGWILNKPVYSVYHTQFPQFAGTLTGRPHLEDLTWSYMKLFHGLTQRTFVPSDWMKNDLVRAGFDPATLTTYPRGTDLSRFTRMEKSPDAPASDKVRFVYVGRVSREKGLENLVEAYKNICSLQNVELDIIGDGPYRAEMQAQLALTNARFRGYVSGSDLVQAYSDADCFVFPSATDTWGNVVLEAEACGLPALVTDSGGPQENIRVGDTGLVYPAGDVNGLTQRMLQMTDKGRCQAMGEAAHTYAQTRSFDEAFQNFWHMLRADTDVTPPARPDLVRSFLKAYDSSGCVQPRGV